MKNLIRIYDRLREEVLKAARLVLFNPFNKEKAYVKILIVRKGTIGDHIVCQPIYLAIKNQFSNAQLHLLTSNGGNNYAHISNLPEATLFDKTFNFDDFNKKELMAMLKRPVRVQNLTGLSN